MMATEEAELQKRHIYKPKDVVAACLRNNLCAIERCVLPELCTLSLHTIFLCGLICTHTMAQGTQKNKHLPKHPTNTKMCEKECLAKDGKEKKMWKQRQRRGKKKNKLPKCTAGRKLFILNEEADCNLAGCNCKRTEHAKDLHYDDCKICISSIPTYHMNHTPHSQDSDTSVSHTRYKEDKQYRRNVTEC
jgi:hypothetical protein